MQCTTHTRGPAPLIGSRWTARHITRRCAVSGAFEEVNSPIHTRTEAQVQRALLAPQSPRLPLMRRLPLRVLVWRGIGAAAVAAMVAAVLSMPTPAHATGASSPPQHGHKPPPAKPAAPPAQQQWSTSGAEASADAAAHAAAQAATGAVSSQQSIAGDRSSMYVLPAPVWTTTPPTGTCIRSTSSAFSIGWNFFSVSNSETFTEWEACMQRFLREQAAIVAEMRKTVAAVEAPPAAEPPPPAVTPPATGPCKTPGFRRNSAGRCYDPAWTRQGGSATKPCPAGSTRRSVCVVTEAPAAPQQQRSSAREGKAT